MSDTQSGTTPLTNLGKEVSRNVIQAEGYAKTGSFGFPPALNNKNDCIISNINGQSHRTILKKESIKKLTIGTQDGCALGNRYGLPPHASGSAPRIPHSTITRGDIRGTSGLQYNDQPLATKPNILERWLSTNNIPHRVPQISRNGDTLRAARIEGAENRNISGNKTTTKIIRTSRIITMACWYIKM